MKKYVLRCLGLLAVAGAASSRAAGNFQFFMQNGPRVLRPEQAAATSVESFFESRDRKRFAVSYLDDSHFRVDLFGFAADGWQQSIESRDFATSQGAESWLRVQGLESSPESRIAESAELARRNVKHKFLATQPLWEIRESWSSEWETRYSAWVHEQVDENFFVKYQIPTDCADVAYVLRWIFSRNNHLPAGNRLAGSNQRFTTLDTRAEWMRLPTDPDWSKDQRLRAALNYLLDNTYTHTLIRDSYPIAVTPEAFSAGSYHVGIHGESGHTQFFFKSKGNAYGLPFMMISSTVPRTVRSVMVHFFWGEQPKARMEAAFLRMDWAVKNGSSIVLKSESSHPWYSMQQFDKTFFDSQQPGDFPIKLIQKLDPEFDVVQVAHRVLDDIKTQILDRVRVVQEGYAVCTRESCTPDSTNYDNWSTPSRDDRTKSQIKMSSAIFAFCENCEEVVQDFTETPVDIGGRQEKLQTLAYALYTQKASSDPRVPPLQRWGLDATSVLQNSAEPWTKSLTARAGLVRAAKDSFDDDLVFTRAVSQVSQYLNYTGIGNDGTIQEVLKDIPLSIAGIPQKNLAEVYRDLPYWSSAKEAPAGERWSTENSSPYARLDQESLITPQGWSWSIQTGKLVDLRAGHELPLPEGFDRWSLLSEDGDQAFLKRKGDAFFTYAALDEHGAATKTLEFPETVRTNGAYSQIIFYDAHLVLRQGPTITLLAIEDSLRVVDQFTMSENKTTQSAQGRIRLRSRDSIWGYDDSHHFRFLDQSHPEKGYQTIELPDQKSPYQIIENERWAVICLAEESLRSFRWNKVSGELTPFIPRVQGMSSDLRWLSTAPESDEKATGQLIHLDENIESSDRMDFGPSYVSFTKQNGIIWTTITNPKTGASNVLAAKATEAGKIQKLLELEQTYFGGVVGDRYFSLFKLTEGETRTVKTSVWSYDQAGAPHLLRDLPTNTSFDSVFSDDESLWGAEMQFFNVGGGTKYQIKYRCGSQDRRPPSLTAGLAYGFGDNDDPGNVRIFGRNVLGPDYGFAIIGVYSGSVVSKGHTSLWLKPELCAE